MIDQNKEHHSVHKQIKSLFWKTGMVMVSYFIAIFFASLIFTAIWFFVHVTSGHDLTDLFKTDPGYSPLMHLIITLGGWVGIWFGVRYVALKTIIDKKDNKNSRLVYHNQSYYSCAKYFSNTYIDTDFRYNYFSSQLWDNQFLL